MSFCSRVFQPFKAALNIPVLELIKLILRYMPLSACLPYVAQYFGQFQNAQSFEGNLIFRRRRQVRIALNAMVPGVEIYLLAPRTVEAYFHVNPAAARAVYKTPGYGVPIPHNARPLSSSLGGKLPSLLNPLREFK